MKNITLAIDEEILDKVRIVAAEKKTTVNALVVNFWLTSPAAMKGLRRLESSFCG